MEANLTIKYEYDDAHQRQRVLRLLEADSAWCALHQIQEEILRDRKWGHDDSEPDEIYSRVEKLRKSIMEIILETKLDERWT
jgi:hypothetical protein